MGRIEQRGNAAEAMLAHAENNRTFGQNRLLIGVAKASPSGKIETDGRGVGEPRCDGRAGA